MDTVFVKNDAPGSLNRWELDTVALASLKAQRIKLPDFFFNTGQDIVKCHVFICRNRYFPESLIFDVKIKTEDGQSISNDFISVTSLQDESNKILLYGLKTHDLGSSQRALSQTYTLWNLLNISNLRKLKFDHGRIFLSLYLSSNSMRVSRQSQGNFFDAAKLDPDAYCCRFTKNFAKFFIQDNLLSDATVVSKNKEFRIHKNIFSARSSYFAAIFSHDLIEKQSSRVLIKNKNGELVEDSVVEELIRYVYTGTVKNMDRVSAELFELADMYNLTFLQEICAGYMKINVSSENAVSLLKVAKQHDLQELRDKVLNFIKRQQTFAFESLFLISSKLWSCEPFEIESNVLKTNDRSDNTYEFKFKIKKASNDYLFSMELLSKNIGSFSATLIFGLCDSGRKPISNSHQVLILSNSASEILFSRKIISSEEIKDLLLSHNEIFLNVFIWDQSLASENLSNLNCYVNLERSGEEQESHHCQTAKDISSLYNNENFSDFKIKAKDGVVFHAHTNILAANITKFLSKFKSSTDLREFDGNCLSIDMESKVVEAMLRYTYGGSTEKFPAFVAELYILAEDYGFERLRNECLHHLN